MNYIFYCGRYSVIMMIAHFIRLVGISSVFSYNYPFIWIFCLMALFFGVIVPLDKKNDISYDKLVIPLIINSLILITLFMSKEGSPIFWIIVSNIISAVEIFAFKYKY